MNLLVFRLEGPMQSWGEHSHWDHRDTALMPTKSGVVGLIGCCLGYPRGDERLVELSRSIRIAVRVDRSGWIMTDYHTVRGTGGVLLNAQRKKRSGDTIITPRQYLEGAAFQVFIEGDDETLGLCERAMRSPHWPPFLGRKCCPPAVPLIPRMVSCASIEEAVRVYPIDERDLNQLGPVGSMLQAEIECAPEGETGGAETVRVRLDEVVDAARDVYVGRRVRVVGVRVEGASACS